MKVRTLHWKRAVYTVLFTLLLSVAGVTNAFAQQRVAKNDIRSFKVDSKKGIALGNEVSASSASNFAPQTAKNVITNRYDNIEDDESMWTTYDLQSNGWCSNRPAKGMPYFSTSAVSVIPVSSVLSNSFTQLHSRLSPVGISSMGLL